MTTPLAYAEQMPYWDTTVSPGNSQGDITEMLDEFGANAIMMTQGSSNGRYVWVVRFQWNGRTYRFIFTPYPCISPNTVNSFGGKRRSREEQAKYQMGRVAVNFVKAILTAAGTTPAALFGFVELQPGAANGKTITAAELDVEGLVSALPLLLLEEGEQ